MAKHAGVGISASDPTLPGDRSGSHTTAPRHSAPGRPWAGHPVIVVLAVIAGLVAVTAIVIGTLNTGPDQAAPSPSALGVPGNSAAAAAPASPRPVEPALVQSAAATAISATDGMPLLTLTGSSAALLQETGPGLSQPGILLVASPAADGSFDILERIRLVRPVGVLTLRPALVARAGQQFASASAAASALQVSAGGRPVDIPNAKVDHALTVVVPQADRFELRYRLTDVTVRSAPSSAGRALAAIGPLTGGVDDELPVLFIASGGSVLGLNCPLLPLSQQTCGSRWQTGPGRQHELPWRLAIATVQFDLPPG